MTSLKIHTDIIIIVLLNENVWNEQEQRGARLSHDIIIHSITMMHCVVWQWLSIRFIWHFIAVRSQQLSAILKGGRSLIVHRDRAARGSQEMEGRGNIGNIVGEKWECEREGWESEKKKETTTTVSARSLWCRAGLSSSSRGFPSYFRSADA